MRLFGNMTARSLKTLPILIIAVLLAMLALARVNAAVPNVLPARFDKLSASTASAVSIHDVGFTISNMSIPIGSISFQFCSNSPIIGDVCTAPSGFDVSAATLSSSSGEPGFLLAPGSTANQMLLSRPAALPKGVASQFVISNIKNPDSIGSYYLRVQTYTSSDGSGASVQYGGMVFVIASTLSVATEVPPYLTFCVGVTIVGMDCSTINSYFIDVGELSTKITKTASSEFVIATNAQGGYAISLSGASLTSGSNVIPAIVPATNSQTGISQFGFNLRANTSPGIGVDPSGYMAGSVAAPYNTPNQYQFKNGDILVSATSTSDYEKFTASYITNISTAQAPGTYNTTLTYIALANF